MSFLSGLCWGLYLALGPVYWLPVISVEALSLIKTTLIVLAILCSILFAIQKKSFLIPSGLYGPLGFLFIILLSSSGFLLAESQEVAIKKFLDIFYGFATLWSFYLYYISSEGKTFPFVLASLLMSVLSLLVISSYILNTPSWVPPTIYSNFSLSIAGFGALRTGWSNGISFFSVAVALIVLSTKQKITNSQYFVSGLIALSIIGSQIVVAGRAGLLASIIGLGIVFWSAAPKLSKYSMPLLIVVFVSVLIITGDLQHHLRLDRLEGGRNSSLSMEAINHFSAGRITTYMYGIEKWFESPLLGHGFGQVDVIKGHEIHNLWLRLTTETGPLLPLVFLFGILKLLFQVKRLNRQQNTQAIERVKRVIFSGIIIQGVVISLFEPRMLLGSFQNCAIWWASLGAALASMRLSKRDANVNK